MNVQIVIAVTFCTQKYLSTRIKENNTFPIQTQNCHNFDCKILDIKNN